MVKLFTLVALAGCATQQKQLQARQDGAVQTALQRGRFDLNCPAATATVLSRDYIQPAVQGPWVSGLSASNTRSASRAATSARHT